MWPCEEIKNSIIAISSNRQAWVMRPMLASPCCTASFFIFKIESKYFMINIIFIKKLKILGFISFIRPHVSDLRSVGDVWFPSGTGNSRYSVATICGAEDSRHTCGVVLH